MNICNNITWGESCPEAKQQHSSIGGGTVVREQESQASHLSPDSVLIEGRTSILTCQRGESHSLRSQNPKSQGTHNQTERFKSLKWAEKNKRSKPPKRHQILACNMRISRTCACSLMIASTTNNKVSKKAYCSITLPPPPPPLGRFSNQMSPPLPSTHRFQASS